MFRTIIFRIAHLGLQFAAGILLSNLLLPAAFGSVSLLILNAALLSIVTGLGTEALVTHKMSRQSWTARDGIRFLGKSFAVQLLLFLILEFSFISLQGRTLLGSGGVNGWWLELLYFFGLALTEKSVAILFPLHKDRAVSRMLAVISLSYLLVLSIAALLSFRLYSGLMFIFATQMLLQGLAAGYMVLKLPQAEVSNSESAGYWKHLKVSSIVMITNIVQLLAYRIDFWLLKYHHGNDAVGVYAQSNKFANLTWIIPSMAAQLLIPRFHNIPAWGRQAIFGIAVFINIFFALGAALTGYILFEFFLDPGYALGWGAQWRMMPGYYAWSFVILAAAYISYEGKFLYNLICSGVCLLLVAVADLILIPRMGINGAAIANSIAYSLVAIIYLILLQKRFQIDAFAGLKLGRKSLSQTIALFR